MHDQQQVHKKKQIIQQETSSLILCKEINSYIYSIFYILKTDCRTWEI
jgi:hypothetical protein